jgi:sulfopyruvate decarboxylase TPP-binding subunit
LTSTSHCTRVGGRVEERSEQAASQEDGDARAVGDLVVRVPADELTGVLAGLEELGDVADVRVSRST